MPQPGPRAISAPTWLALAAALALGGVAGHAAALPADLAPAVEVSEDGHGASGLVRATIDIDAPPATVWRLLIDCADAPRLMVNLKSCRVVDRDPAGHWDVRENISRGSFLPGVRTVVRADYSAPYLIRFHRVDGDLKVLEGEWRLTATDDGAQTHLAYESRVAAPFAAPGVIVRAVLRHDMPITLSNLRRACEDQAAAQRP